MNPGKSWFSPDGQWIAVAAERSDRQEIFVQSFPEPHTRIQVSTSGGMQPRWSNDGKELF